MRYPRIHRLETPRLVLRQITREDVPQYFSGLFGKERVAEHMLWEPHREQAQSAAAVEKVLQRYAAGKYYRWGITRKGEDLLIGIIELLRFREETGDCSFAYMLSDDHWGKGYGTEAVEAVFAFAFEEMEAASITADHFARNPASGAVMRKAGMRYVRDLPGKYEKNGVPLDAVEYRITKEEWNEKTRC